MSTVNKKCQVPTPIEIVRKMLNQVGYKKDLYGKKVLENSCGEGGFLVEIVCRYIKDCQRQHKSNEEICIGLQRDIRGFEKDRRLHKLCIQNLTQTARALGLNHVHWNIKRADALHQKKKQQYQFVIGNPPYLAYPDLDIATRKYLRENFKSCVKGKPDYYYAFIEASLEALAPDGKLAYLVPGNFMKNLHADILRQRLLPSLYKILDYSHQRLFDDYLTSSAILLCDRGRRTNAVHYEDKHYRRALLMPKAAMRSKWVFEEPGEHVREQVYFEEYFHSSAPVATQLNRAFVLKKWQALQPGFVQCGPYAIEDAVVRNAAGPKAMQRGRLEKIIFPYAYDGQGALLHYREAEFAENFPGAYAYLIQFREALEARKKDKRAAWFEYGRSQLLTHLMQEKLSLSTFVTERPRVYLLPDETVTYAGICVTARPGYTVSQAQAVLETDAFMDYVKNVGVCTNGISYRISPRDINAFRFSCELVEE